MARITGIGELDAVSALTLLLLWADGRWALMEEDYDELVGVVHGELERLNDERWRFNKNARPSLKPDLADK